jgi:hypothetical protein
MADKQQMDDAELDLRLVLMEQDEDESFRAQAGYDFERVTTVWVIQERIVAITLVDHAQDHQD